ncbi:hypothetical protein JXA05_03330 [Candidatus Peregrinibacteria bacterium]|nr:hypothetical protein [Candidatus Peregrinibacteria bacterium]
MTDSATTTSNTLYSEIIFLHQAYLDRLQDAFETRCETIKAESQKKLAATPEGDTDTRKMILEEEKNLLDQTLAELRATINESDKKTRAKLEEIENNKVSVESEIEKALTQIN